MAQKSKKKPAVNKPLKQKAKTEEPPKPEKKLDKVQKLLGVIISITVIITFIFTFPKLIRDCSTEKSARFYGIVIDETAKPVADAEIEVQEKEGEKVRIGIDTTKPNGEFSFMVKADPKTAVWVTVTKDRHIGFQGYKILLGNTKIIFKREP